MLVFPAIICISALLHETTQQPQILPLNGQPQAGNDYSLNGQAQAGKNNSTKRNINTIVVILIISFINHNH